MEIHLKHVCTIVLPCPGVSVGVEAQGIFLLLLHLRNLELWNCSNHGYFD